MRSLIAAPAVAVARLFVAEVLGEKKILDVGDV